MNEDLYKDQKKFIKPFTCFICSLITINPVQCGNCHVIFCKNCINDVMKKNNICPNNQCSKSPFDEREIDKNMRKMLDESSFNCPLSCGKVFQYNQFDSHKAICQNLKSTFRCSLCQEDINENIDDNFKKHKCKKLICICLLCNQQINKLEYDFHLNNKCEKGQKFCDKLQIYYNSKFNKAFEEEFKDLLLIYHSFYGEFKKISIF